MQIQAAVSPELNHRLYNRNWVEMLSSVRSRITQWCIASVCPGSNRIRHLINTPKEDFLDHVAKPSLWSLLIQMRRSGSSVCIKKKKRTVASPWDEGITLEHCTPAPNAYLSRHTIQHWLLICLCTRCCFLRSYHTLMMPIKKANTTDPSYI